MSFQKIETIKRKFHREWLLIQVEKMDEHRTIPLTGKLLAHNPRRDEIYRKLFSFKKRKWMPLVEYSEDRLPQGHAVAF